MPGLRSLLNYVAAAFAFWPLASCGAAKSGSLTQSLVEAREREPRTIRLDVTEIVKAHFRDLEESLEVFDELRSDGFTVNDSFPVEVIRSVCPDSDELVSATKTLRRGLLGESDQAVALFCLNAGAIVEISARIELKSL